MQWERRKTLKNRGAWLAARRIGASDVAKILGVSQWGTSWDVWCRLTGRGKAKEATAVQARGIRWEPIVMHLYGGEVAQPVRAAEPNAIWQGPESWATCTPDGYVEDDFAGWGCVEAKTDRVGLWGKSQTIERWAEGTEDIVRPDYALQCYWQAWVCDAPFVDLTVLLPFYELRTYRIVRDLETERVLIDTVGEWYARHVTTDTPPDIDASGACADYLAERFRDTTGQRRIATPDEAALAMAYHTAVEEKKHYEKERLRLRSELLQAIGSDAGIVFGPNHKARATVTRTLSGSVYPKVYLPK